MFLGQRVVVLGCDPGRVAADIEVPLGDERDLPRKRRPEFLALRSSIEDIVRAHHHRASCIRGWASPPPARAPVSQPRPSVVDDDALSSRPPGGSGCGSKPDRVARVQVAGGRTGSDPAAGRSARATPGLSSVGAGAGLDLLDGDRVAATSAATARRLVRVADVVDDDALRLARAGRAAGRADASRRMEAGRRIAAGSPGGSGWSVEADASAPGRREDLGHRPRLVERRAPGAADRRRRREACPGRRGRPRPEVSGPPRPVGEVSGAAEARRRGVGSAGTAQAGGDVVSRPDMLALLTRSSTVDRARGRTRPGSRAGSRSFALRSYPASAVAGSCASCRAKPPSEQQLARVRRQCGDEPSSGRTPGRNGFRWHQRDRRTNRRQGTGVLPTVGGYTAVPGRRESDPNGQTRVIGTQFAVLKVPLASGTSSVAVLRRSARTPWPGADRVVLRGSGGVDRGLLSSTYHGA